MRKAILYYRADQASAAKAVKVMLDLHQEYGENAFGLELIDIDSPTHTEVREVVITVPLLIIFDEQEHLPIVGDFEKQRTDICKRLGLQSSGRKELSG